MTKHITCLCGSTTWRIRMVGLDYPARKYQLTYVCDKCGHSTAIIVCTLHSLHIDDQAGVSEWDDKVDGVLL